MEKSIKEDKINNKLIKEMIPSDFCKKVGIDRKGKLKSIYINWNDYDEKLDIKIEIETEDKLKQIDYTKTVNK